MLGLTTEEKVSTIFSTIIGEINNFIDKFMYLLANGLATDFSMNRRFEDRTGAGSGATQMPTSKRHFKLQLGIDPELSANIAAFDGLNEQIWNFMALFVDLMFYELFVEDNETETYLVMRPKSYYDLYTRTMDQDRQQPSANRK